MNFISIQRLCSKSLKVSNKAIQVHNFQLRNCLSSSTSAALSEKKNKTLQELEDYKVVFAYPHAFKVAIFQRVKVSHCWKNTIEFDSLISVQIFATGTVGLLGGVAAGLGSEYTPVILTAIFVTFQSCILTGLFASRIIGRLYLHQDGEQVRFATCNFWGRRRDFFVKVDDIKLVSDTSANTSNAFWSVHFHNNVQSRLLISTKHGGIQDAQSFKMLLGKSAFDK